MALAHARKIGWNVTKLICCDHRYTLQALLRVAANFIMGNRYYFYLKNTAKAITIKVFIIYFGTNSRIVAKFQPDRFRNGDENYADKNSKEITPTKPEPQLSCWLTGPQAASISEHRMLWKNQQQTAL